MGPVYNNNTSFWCLSWEAILKHNGERWIKDMKLKWTIDPKLFKAPECFSGCWSSCFMWPSDIPEIKVQKGCSRCKKVMFLEKLLLYCNSKMSLQEMCWFYCEKDCLIKRNCELLYGEVPFHGISSLSIALCSCVKNVLGKRKCMWGLRAPDRATLAIKLVVFSVVVFLNSKFFRFRSHEGTH